MRDFINFIKKIFGKNQKKLPCPAVVEDYIILKPFYDRSDSYWE